MRKITFVISGNQEDANGNPIAFTKVSPRTSRSSKAKKYNAWKSYVRKTFFKFYPEYLIRVENMLLTQVPPFTTLASQKSSMEVRVFWAQGIQGFPYEVFKGISEALFKSDRFLDGGFETHYSQDGVGRVEVDIYLNI